MRGERERKALNHIGKGIKLKIPPTFRNDLQLECLSRSPFGAVKDLLFSRCFFLLKLCLFSEGSSRLSFVCGYALLQRMSVNTISEFSSYPKFFTISFKTHCCNNCFFRLFKQMLRKQEVLLTELNFIEFYRRAWEGKSSNT